MGYQWRGTSYFVTFPKPSNSRISSAGPNSNFVGLALKQQQHTILT
ncbi:MAG: hypothetical protein Q8P67_23885 [archaeon]|nr:hypothetical protein [archaeon]